MSVEEALTRVDELVFQKTGQHLDELQKAIFRGSWDKEKYNKIAQGSGYDEQYVKSGGSVLWSLISSVLGKTVNKTTFRSILEQYKPTSVSPTLRHPNQDKTSPLQEQMENWFKVLGYSFEKNYEVWEKNYFEWIINVPARRGYDRILVRGKEGEATINDTHQIKELMQHHKVDEAWIVVQRRISTAARQEAEKAKNIYCYTFDELIEENADFRKYFTWLEEQVKSKEVDRYYVPLACTKEEINPDTKHRLGTSHYDESQGWIEGYIDKWLDDPVKEHISILGEFGTGKTWFVFHYAWSKLQEYLEAKRKGIQRPRIPIVILLRDYAKAVTVESLFSEFFFRKHELSLSGYSAFEQLNRMEKLLLIFDGFDEMADRIDKQAMVNNFWELAKVVVSGSKVILTCRDEHFPDAQLGRALLNAELKASTSNLTGEPPQFEILKLEPFNDEQIRRVLSFRTQPETIEKIMNNPELRDLARRPIMIELILEALPAIETGKPIDISRIYLYAVTEKMNRDIKNVRTFTSLEQKLYFLCELSWEMLSSDRMSLNYREFPEHIRRCFSQEVQEEKDLDHWHHDMMGQTLLIRNSEGDYMPAHRSLLEFFVAYKFAAELGILAVDFAEIANLSYFSSQNDLTATFGYLPLSKALIDLMLPMLDPKKSQAKFLEIITGTKGKTEDEVQYLGGNAVTLLLRLNPLALQGLDLSRSVIIRGNFIDALLYRVNFTGANLKESEFNRVFGNVLSVGFSSDGQYFATGHHDATIRIWQTINGRETITLRGHQDEVNSVVFSSDGLTLASGSWDKTIKLWAVGTGKCLFTLDGHQNSVSSVVFSSDGLTLASGSWDKTIKLWAVGTGDCLHILEGHQDEVTSVAFSPDGLTLASGSWDKTIKLWAVGTGDCLHILEGHQDEVTSVAFSPDGLTLASGSWDKTIKLWDVGTGDCLRTLEDHQALVSSVAFSSDGLILASGSDDDTIKLWAVKTGDCLDTLESYQTSVNSVAFSPDGLTLVSGSLYDTIKLWAVKTGEYLFTLEGYQASVNSVAFSPDGLTVASGSDDDTIKLWDVKTGECLRTLEGHQYCVTSVVFNPDGRTLVSGSGDSTIKLWDVGAGDCLCTLEGHRNSVNSVTFTADGRVLASGSDDKTIKLWSVGTGDCLRTLEGHRNSVNSVAISPDGRVLASGSDDKTIKLWSVGMGDCLRTLEGHRNSVNSVAISPDGLTLVNGSGDSTIKLWDIGTGKCLITLESHQPWVNSVAFTSDGRTLVSGSVDSTIKLWDVGTGDCRFTLEGHQNWVNSVAFSPDGLILASGSSDNTIKLWSVETGECLKTIDHRLCAGMDITGVSGLTEAEKATLKALGAVEEERQ